MITFDTLGLRGRLGNALYQLAATVGLGERLGEPVRFNADWMHRPYFCVPDELFGDCTGGTPAWELREVNHIDARARTYLQDWNLCSGIMPTIRRYFAPSPFAREILAEQRAQFDKLPRPILSVHVRRGDAVQENDRFTPNKWRFHPCLPLSYYQRAIDLLKDNARSIAVFGDEPEWNEANIPADYIHYGTPRPTDHDDDFLTAPVLDWIDLQLMAECEIHSLANSTFGMWAALLAGDEHAVMPWPMFGPALSYIDASLLGPSTWKRLGYS